MRASSLTELARAGFDDLSAASENLDALEVASQLSRETWVSDLRNAADADRALVDVLRLVQSEHPGWLKSGLSTNALQRLELVRLFGASSGIAGFFLRQPIELENFRERRATLRTASQYEESLLRSVQEESGYSSLRGEEAWSALRNAYRQHLIEIMLVDIGATDPNEHFSEIAAALSDLAGATLQAALAVARTNVLEGEGVGKSYSRRQIDLTKIAVIAMGKCGARELNYVSDVDVVFVAESADETELSTDIAIACGTRIVTEMMRAIHEASHEPALWQVDPNLRPEGKSGPLVRTLASHMAYYERWAKSWEFQALLKARAVAGDPILGEQYVIQTRPLVWNSASRENFVESAQRMRERVTENIPDEHVHFQIKLGPGGLRDVEFTVQLLQLVHGQKNSSVHASATLDAITQLADGGYIARADGDELAASYRILRVLEHRLQMRELSRTALFPTAEEDQRWLARASGLAANATELVRMWERTKEQVRNLHLKIFYAPLLSAVAALPEDEFVLTGEEAADRLAAIGFRDPAGALRHIAALTGGVSRRAVIQRNLLPVLLQWLSAGADPDFGLLSFRRISDHLGNTPWYLRLLRDSTGAALRLTQLLSSSRFVAELMEVIPESVAWLDGDEDLVPASGQELSEELDALLKRHRTIDKATPHLLTVRRREALRLAMGSMLAVLSVDEVASGLTELYEALLQTTLRGVRQKLNEKDPLVPESETIDGIEFAIVEVGRFGSAELGFSSDLDLMFVYRALEAEPEAAAKRATAITNELKRLLEDPKLSLDIDLDLRPEGRAGARVRTLESYRSYYERWSLTWEAQALLRARCDIGDPALCHDFTALANDIRYPARFDDDQLREIRLLKARVENERLPQGADPARHLKLGRGSVSDVEWLVQLLQLRHAHEHPVLQVQSTLRALDECVSLALISPDDAGLLREAWMLSSELRSAHMLWANRASDVLPRDRFELEGISRIMNQPPGSTTILEDRYMAVTRRARTVFEREFFGIEPEEPVGYTFNSM